MKMSMCRICETIIAGMILAFSAAAYAQEDADRSETPRSPNYGPGGSTLINLLANPRVQAELGLAEFESKKLLDSLREIDPAHPAFRTQEERQRQEAAYREMMDKVERKSEAAIQKSLSEEQSRRFQQLELQYQSGEALLNPEIARRLALTAAQQKTLETLKEEFRLAGQANRSSATPGTPRPDHESASARLDKYKADLLGVLSPEQANQWQAMTGARFEIPKSVEGFPFQLVAFPEVQKELGLSEDEAGAISQSLTAIRREEHKEFSQAFVSSRAVGSAANQKRQSQLNETVRSSLTVSQWNRLQELVLQQWGVMLFSLTEVPKALGLSQEQRDRIRATTQKSLREFTANRLLLKPGEAQAHRQKEQADLLEILTPEQKIKWEAMQGAQADLGYPLGIR